MLKPHEDMFDAFAAIDRLIGSPHAGDPARFYYREMAALDHATLRRAWIAEGKRRGYVLEDA